MLHWFLTVDIVACQDDYLNSAIEYSCVYVSVYMCAHVGIVLGANLKGDCVLL